MNTHDTHIVDSINVLSQDFEKNNRDILAELDLLGFDIDEYEASLTADLPQVHTNTNSTLQ